MSFPFTLLLTKLQETPSAPMALPIPPPVLPVFPVQPDRAGSSMRLLVHDLPPCPPWSTLCPDFFQFPGS